MGRRGGRRRSGRGCFLSLGNARVIVNGLVRAVVGGLPMYMASPAVDKIASTAMIGPRIAYRSEMMDEPIDTGPDSVLASKCGEAVRSPTIATAYGGMLMS